MTYRPAKLVNQHRDANGRPWGTRYDSSNCWAAATSEAIDFMTEGRLHPTPPTIRKVAGVKRRAGRLVDVARACQHFGIAVETYYGLPWDRVEEMLQHERVLVHFQTDYEFIPDKVSCSPGFDEGHVILFYGGTEKVVSGARTYLSSDPVCENRKRMPLWMVKRAATEYAEQNGHPTDTVVVAVYRQPKPPREEKPPKPDRTIEQQLADALERVEDLGQEVELLETEAEALEEEVSRFENILGVVAGLVQGYGPFSFPFGDPEEAEGADVVVVEGAA